jgi:hypothetical protein
MTDSDYSLHILVSLSGFDSTCVTSIHLLQVISSCTISLSIFLLFFSFYTHSQVSLLLVSRPDLPLTHNYYPALTATPRLKSAEVAALSLDHG